MDLDTHELAWAAGLVDGEGWIGGKVLQLTISQVDRRVLDRAQQALGFGNVAGPHARNKTYRNARPQFSLNICNFEHAQAAICLLWRWLNPVKRVQALGALRRYAERPMTYKHRARITLKQREQIISRQPPRYSQQWATALSQELGVSVSSIRRALGHNA